MIIARNARRIRLENGWTVREMSESSGYHRTWISSVELGGRNLTLSSIERHAAALGVSPLDLLDDRDGATRSVDGEGAAAPPPP